jgi:hypothetical protein
VAVKTYAPTLPEGCGDTSPHHRCTNRRTMLRTVGRAAGVLAAGSVADALAPAPAKADEVPDASQSQANIVFPFRNSVLPGRHVLYSFSTANTCDRNPNADPTGLSGLTTGPHDVDWYLDNTWLGHATVREGISVQQIYVTEPSKEHHFTVKSYCGGADVTFETFTPAQKKSQEPSIRDVKIVFPIEQPGAAPGLGTSESHGLLSFSVQSIPPDLRNRDALGPYTVRWGMTRNGQAPMPLGWAMFNVALSVQHIHAFGAGSYTFWVDAPPECGGSRSVSYSI